MRFMVIVKANPDTEAGVLPDAEMVAAMGVYNDMLIAAGVMLDAAGLKPSSKGARVHFESGKPLVVDGPFAETKEIVGGYWILECASLAECVEWVKKAPYAGGHLEIRPFYEPEDFAGVATPELIEQEKGWREAQARAAPKGA